MKTLSIDIETYSSVDIRKSGMYKYVQSLDFEILLFAYSFDNEPVQIIDLVQGDIIPCHIISALNDPFIIKHAYNASFEYYCLNKIFTSRLDQWRCTMAHGLYLGFPAGLGAIGTALNFDEDKKKMAAGKALIKYFCTPCAPTQRNGGRLRNYPKHDSDKWDLFKLYCIQDVVTEMAVKNQLLRYPMPDSEQKLWELDQVINLNGIGLDMYLVESALAVNDQMTEELTARAIELTGLENPNSVAQLKPWLEEHTGYKIDSLDKQTVSDLLICEMPEDAEEMLEIRKEMAKTSIKKYATMDAAVCDDGRVRGLLQYYGANRTGRWAGRLVQVQNLPRNYIESLGTARDLVKKRNIDALKMIYGNVPDTLSQLIRTAFVPGEGCRFAVSDFSAIEARVIAWLANENWRMGVFQTHGKIYEASASAMFGVPLESIKKGNPEYALRAKGKVAELALGYQGASGALIQMGALNMGLEEADLPDIVQRWRKANRRIVDFWYGVEKRAVECVEYGVISTMDHGITFMRDERRLMIILPGGRRLFYNDPRLILNDRGFKQLWFMGMDQTTKKWGLVQTYGGKLVENIVQAVARDCLAHAMTNLHGAGYKINMHIHDEVVLEIPEDGWQSLDQAIKIMCQQPEWAAGLPLNADGFVSDYYKKD